LSAVQEAMNQMMGSAATSMSTIFSKRVDISPPSIDILNVSQGEGTDKIPEDDLFVKVSFRLKIGDLIDSNIMQLLQLDFAKSLVGELLNPTAETTQEVNEPVNTASSLQQQTSNGYPAQSRPIEQHNESIGMNQAPYRSGQWGQQEQPYFQEPYPANNQMPMQSAPQHTGPQHFGSTYAIGAQPNVQPAMFSNFEPYHLQETEAKNLDMLLDIPLQVTVELGRTKRSVKEILELSPGSIIELDKLAGEPVDIHINNRLIAKGEVVVIDENFGVRVTDIISQSDRLRKLK
jgi:flagellar motor switch protein FliN